MPEHKLFHVFISRLNALGVHYMITGSVASMIYGEPRLTHDIDLVVELNKDDIDAPLGRLHIQSYWQALNDGRNYLTTVIFMSDRNRK